MSQGDWKVTHPNGHSSKGSMVMHLKGHWSNESRLWVIMLLKGQWSNESVRLEGHTSEWSLI